MAKKRKKKRDRHPTKPDDPRALRTPSTPSRESEPESDVGETSTSLPPTKKSALPPELAHDDREVAAATIGKATAALAAFVAVSMVAMWFFDKATSDKERQGHTPPLPMATTQPSVPEGPLLQRVPRLGLSAFRAREEEELTTYGWVDREAGKVRIPIERAMELTVQRGLPARSTTPDKPSVTLPTDSSLDPPRGEP